MLGNPEQTFTGNETIDILKGTQIVVAKLPTMEDKVARFKQVLSLLPHDTFNGYIFDVNAELALAKSEDRGPKDRDPISDVQVIGRVAVKPYNYVEIEDIPLDSLTVRLLEPVFIDYDPAASLGYTPSVIELPVSHINTFLNAA